MNDPHLVRATQRRRDLKRDLRCPDPRERTPFELPVKGHAFDVFHDEIRDAVHLAAIGNLDDVLVIDPIDCASLAQETLVVGRG